MSDDQGLRRSSRIASVKLSTQARDTAPSAEVISNLEESDLEDNDYIDCDTEMNRTVVQGESVATMEEINEQLLELRAQLEAATNNAAMEKAERQRLQELLHQKQNDNVSESSVTDTSTCTTTSAKESIHSGGSVPMFSNANIYTSATNTTMCPSVVPTQFMPTSSSMFMPPQQQQSTMTANLAQATTSTYVQRVPTFMSPINTLSPPLMQESFIPPPPPTQTSSFSALSQSVYQQSAMGSRKLFDLPEFTGRPEGWPIFVTSFLESTSMMNYTKVENMFRLQKCLKGEAREVVESLLIHPNNVERVMSALEFRFGRPECLVRSQLMKIREIQPIPEGKLELLIPLATKVQNLTTFFEASGMYQHMANPTLLDELITKLPMSKRMDWAQRSVLIQPYPSIRHFEEWLSGVARLVCLVAPSAMLPPANPEQKSKPKNVLHVVERVKPNKASSKICRYCGKESHPVVECQSFDKLDVADRWIFVKKNKLCFSCLRYGHRSRSCKSQRKCASSGCTKTHHTSLHDESHPSTSASSQNSESEKEVNEEKRLLSCNVNKKENILFRVVPVRLYGKNGVIKEYALLDEGSAVTIMSSDIAQRLGLSGEEKKLKLQWFGRETVSKKSYVVDVEISADKENAEKYKMSSVQTIDELNLPTQTLSGVDLQPLRHQLGSCTFAEYQNAKPQILIGLDYCHLGAPVRIIESSNEGPIFAETRLGWVAYGKSATCADEDSYDNFVLHNSQVYDDDIKRLEAVVDEYLCQENFGVKKPIKFPISAADKRALEILSSTTKKINGRYQTGLLLKDDAFSVPESYEMAKGRLHSLENKFMRDLEFAANYREVIAVYLKKGYARKLSSAEAEIQTSRTWYIPHFGVKNPNKPNKIRLVFDAAAKVNNVSLNTFLMKGPDDRPPLVAVLFNFRMRPIAVSADIQEMYHQVLIRPEDQNLQRFLWRESRDKPIEVFVMQAMTFGASCSPCSAEFVKNLNASKFSKSHPRAFEAIVKHHYVDDYVDSFNSVEEAIQVTKTVVAIHAEGGFNLRDFKSNSADVLRSVAGSKGENQQVKQTVDMNIDSVMERVLGMCWSPEEDVFVFRLKFPRVSRDVMEDDRCPTKRELLCMTMSIFDPFGMIANFSVYAKLLLQSVWKCAVGWDDKIPHKIYLRWKQWKADFPALSQFRVPRCHPRLSMPGKIFLHIFVDASEEAYSAVAYLRIDSGDGVFVSFVCGRVKCAPKKLMSIPRLELSAAVLGVRLSNSIVEWHGLRLDGRVFWSDSKTVINQIRSEPRHHKPFVAFRIAEILESSDLNQWRWVPSKLNPADEATRARYPPKYHADNKWINGPSFLRCPEEEWPSQPDDISSYTCEEEMRPKFILHLNTVSNPSFNILRFSKYSKMKRAIGWVLRFVKLSRRQSSRRGELSTDELDEAERVLCRQAQGDSYAEEICQLKQNLPVEKNSSLFRLTPYLDDDGLLRVYGRIDMATSIPFSTRRPIIMPKDHRITKLLVDHFHRLLRHQNDDTITNEIRQKFWVPHLRPAVRRSRRECPYCRVRDAKPSPPLMGQLPRDRLTPFVRPFSYTGLDYFGPVYVAVGRRKEKRWIALFTCMTVRAVHLEIAADLSTDACILCIRNFVNRRGVPVRMRSDNGTNFIGAKNELATAEIFDNDSIKAELSSRGIDWVFNCPLNPHAGGCWERLVRTIKRVLKCSLSEVTPKLETLQSALIEAENIVNSRPLTHLPVSTEEEEPLTPNHFILGGKNSTQTPGPIDGRALCLRKQWRVSQQIKDRFWRRWVREYLPVLTRRCKWFQRVPPLKEGDLVLICDADVPRSKWQRGRITRVFPGSDNQIRSAEVKTSAGVLRRPAVKLALLDVSDALVQDQGASRGAGC